MNEKITLPALTQLLALRTGGTRKQAEDLIKVFFASISSSLESGEQVKLKDFGVFKTIEVEARKSVNVSTGEDHEIPAHRKVVFVVAKDLAAEINEPFEMFETVELSDDYADDEPEDADNELLETPVQEYGEDSEDAEDAEDTVVVQDTPVPDSGEDSEDAEEAEEEQETPEQQSEAANSVEEEKETVDPVEEEKDSVEPVEEIKESEEPVEEIKVAVVPVEEIKESSEAEKEEFSQMAEENPDTSDSEVPENEVPENAVSEEEVSENAENEAVENVEEKAEEPMNAEKKRAKSRFGIGFLSGAACMALIGVIAYAVVYFCKVGPFVQEETPATKTEVAEAPVEKAQAEPEAVTAEPEEELASEAGVEAEEPDEVPTQPSDENQKPKKVYDTISTTRYLTTMAKDHYGNYHLWPYIYEENKAFLGHPDRIKPGTQVVIPDLKKYGVSASNPADIEKAKRKGVEIYARYK